MTVPITDGITTMQLRRDGTVLTSPVIYVQLKWQAGWSERD